MPIIIDTVWGYSFVPTGKHMTDIAFCYEWSWLDKADSTCLLLAMAGF